MFDFVARAATGVPVCANSSGGDCIDSVEHLRTAKIFLTRGECRTYTGSAVENTRQVYQILGAQGIKYFDQCRPDGSHYANDTTAMCLEHVFGKSSKKGAAAPGNNFRFPQAPFLTDYNVGFAEHGYVYLPTACQKKSAACGLQVRFHGCGHASPAAQTTQAYAEANNIVVLAPNVPGVEGLDFNGNNATSSCNKGTAVEGNCKEISRGCWDGYGQLSHDYYLQSAPHMQSVWRMIQHLSSGALLKSDDELKLKMKLDDGTARVDDYQRGIQFLGKGMEGGFAYDDPRALQSLRNLAATGASHIALTYSWYLNTTTTHNPSTFRFNAGPIKPIDGPAPSGLNFANCSTPTDHELEVIIAAAHKLNISVKLRPVVQADFPFVGTAGCTLATGGMACPSQTGVGGRFDAAMFQTCFWGAGGTVDQPAEGSYAYYIYHVAALAERTQAEIVSVSVEMTSANPQEAHFRRLISGVRKIYKGTVHADVASAPLSSINAITDVKFWDALDAVGVGAYPALTQGIDINESNPSVEELVAAYTPVLTLMSDFYHGRVPAAPPAPPRAPPCTLGGRITNFSNFWGPHHNMHPTGPTGPNTQFIQYLGEASSTAACDALCRRRSNCTSWTWHPKDKSTSSEHCFARCDGKWMPTFSAGDVWGRVDDKVSPLSCPPLCPPPPLPAPPTRWPAQINNRTGRPTPIVWAENCLTSNPFTYRGPGAAYNPANPNPVCLSCQARYYEAFFKAVACNLDAKDWFKGGELLP